MSRIGKKPIAMPKGVDVSVSGRTITVKGPKGELTRELHRDITVRIDDGQLLVERPSESNQHKALHGLTRTLVANMVEGVTTGFKKSLEIIGVGYRAERKPEGIQLTVGYSHPVRYPAPAGITLETPNPTTIVVSGADKERVGQVAAELRGVRPPEPYKGKGIRYSGEQIRRKAGKTAGA